MNLGRWTGIARLTILALVIGVVVVGLAQAQTSAPVTTAERAAFYDKVAREKSTKAIEQLVRDGLAAKPDPSPHFVIEALLERYFELDPAAAVRFASAQQNAPVDVTHSMYLRLAKSNPNAALAALSLIDYAPLAQHAAAAILDALGRNLANVELVAAALHAGSVDQFRADALMSITSIPPREAFAAALRLRDANLRTVAATTIVARWAQDAPRDAMQEAERVQDPTLRSNLRNSVLQRWADTSSLVAYLNGLDDAGRRTALADGVLYRIADTDPERAAMFAQSLPTGPERSMALQQVVMRYTQKDATAAFQWAQRLDPPQPDLVQSVISFVSASEPLRAFDLVGSLAEPARTQAYFTIIGNGFNRDQRQFEQLAARVGALPDSQNKQVLITSLLTSWAQGPGNVKPALEWALAHSAGLPPEAFMQLGYTLVQSDPEAASAYLDRVPSAARDRWIGAIAFGYVRSDPQRALAFVERFRGDPAYDGAAAALAQHLVSIDPPAAARLLASVTTRPANGAGIEIQIAREWAQRDPQAAATWALDLPPTLRGVAMSMIGDTWGQSNPSAVRAWALGLPPSDKRDFALGAALRAQGPGAPDASVLAAFSDGRLRQAALMTTIMMTATTDVPLARRLVDEHITDPRLRPQAEEMVENVARGRLLPTGTGIRSPVTGLPVQTGVLIGPNGVIGAAPSTIVGSPPQGLVPPFNGPLPSLARPDIRSRDVDAPSARPE